MVVWERVLRGAVSAVGGAEEHAGDGEECCAGCEGREGAGGEGEEAGWGGGERGVEDAG